jgi:hypothetical protein
MPLCDLCDKDAWWDTPTTRNVITLGRWGSLCEEHTALFGVPNSTIRTWIGPEDLRP